MLTDIHSHADQEAGIIRITSLYDTMEIALIPEKKGLFSIGLHPVRMEPANRGTDCALIERIAAHPNVLAIGECGLDKFSTIEFITQAAVFEEHIRISETLKKPLIIHCVRYHQEVLALKKSRKPTQPWVLHGFNNKITIAAPLIEADFYFSFGAALLQESSAAADVLKKVPDNRFFIESDEKSDSFLAIFARAAAIRNLTPTQLESQLLQRFRKVFNYDPTPLA